MEKEELINEANKKIKEKFEKKIKLFNILGLVVVCIVLFIQKELVVRVLTILTLLLIYLMLKSSFKLERETVKCIKDKSYKLIETEIENFEYINQEIDEYKPSRELKFIKFKDSEALFEIEKVDRRFNVGDKVIIQIIEFEEKEYIINVIKLNES